MEYVQWETRVQLWVPGVPVPQGSKQGFVRGNRAVLVDNNAEKLKPWRSQVAAFAMDAWGGREPLDEPVCVHMMFVFPRPSSHFGTGRNAGVLKDGAPRFKTSAPDRDKLERAVNDALTDAGVWRDDSRSVDGGSRKVYGPKPGVRVWIQTIKETTA